MAYNHRWRNRLFCVTGKSSGRPNISDENVERILDNVPRGFPQKSVGRASRALISLACFEETVRRIRLTVTAMRKEDFSFARLFFKRTNKERFPYRVVFRDEVAFPFEREGQSARTREYGD